MQASRLPSRSIAYWAVITATIFGLFVGSLSAVAEPGFKPDFPDGALREYARTHASDHDAVDRWTSLSESPSSAAFRPTSQGRGGETGLVEKNFTASNGKEERYKLVVPGDIGPSKSYGLLLYLHGDGGYDYDWFFDSVKKVAELHHLIPVAAMCPTSNSNGPSWWWDADENAQYLNELIQKEILAKYNIDKTQVIFTGASGGPTFLSGPWIRHFASQFRGGAVLMCGGLVDTKLDFTDAPGFKENFPLFYYNGTSDFLVDLAKQAAGYYKGHEMKVTQDFLDGAGHCQFSMENVLDERVQEIQAHASLRFSK